MPEVAVWQRGSRVRVVVRASVPAHEGLVPVVDTLCRRMHVPADELTTPVGPSVVGPDQWEEAVRVEQERSGVG